MSPWLVVLNNNAKWAIAITIRFLIMFSLLILFILMLKWTGVVSELKNMGETPPVLINQKNLTHESKPSTPTYKSDIEKISDLQKLISDKIKSGRKK